MFVRRKSVHAGVQPGSCAEWASRRKHHLEHMNGGCKRSALFGSKQSEEFNVTSASSGSAFASIVVGTEVVAFARCLDTWEGAHSREDEA